MKKRLITQLTLALVLISLLLSAAQPQTANAGSSEWWSCSSKQNGAWSDYNTWNCYQYGWNYNQFMTPNNLTNVTVYHVVSVGASRTVDAGSLYVAGQLDAGTGIYVWGPTDPSSGVSTNNYLGDMRGGMVDFLCANNNPGTTTQRTITSWGDENSAAYIGLGWNYYYNWCPLQFTLNGNFKQIMSQGSSFPAVTVGNSITLYYYWLQPSGTINFNGQSLTLRSMYNYEVMTTWDSPNVTGLYAVYNYASYWRMPRKMLNVSYLYNAPNKNLFTPDYTGGSVVNINTVDNYGAILLNAYIDFQFGTINNYDGSTFANSNSHTGNTQYKVYVTGNIWMGSTAYSPLYKALVFNGSGEQYVYGMNKIEPYDITVDKPSGTVHFDTNFSTVGHQYPISITRGNLDVGTYQMYASGLWIGGSGGLYLGGTWFPTNANFGTSGVNFSPGCTLGLTAVASQAVNTSTNCYNLYLSGGPKTISANLAINGWLTLANSASLSLGSKNLTVGSLLLVDSSAVFNGGSGVTTLYSGLTVSGGTFTPGTGTISFGGSGAISSSTALNLNNVVINGTLTGPASGTLNVAGDWANNGTFVPNSGTVAFTGTNQIISGNNSFYNLTKTPGAAAVLTFAAGKTQTVTGKLTLKGGSLTNRLALRSSTAGTPWKINATGTFDLDNLDVRDSNNTAAAAIYIPTPAGLNNGNNINWNFVPTTVTSVSAPASGTYIIGQNLDFTVKFANPVSVSTSPKPRLALTLGSTTRYADYYSGTGTSSVVFRYTIVSGDEDTDGVSVGAIDLNSGTIKDLANFNAALTLTNVASTALVKVDGAPPAVTAVSVPANQTYGRNDLLDFSVSFAEPVVVTGTPQLTLVVGVSSKTAAYLGGSGTSVLTFRYIVGATDVDANGIAVSSLGLNSGTINDLNGNAAVLTLNGVASTSGVLVDGTAPAVTSVSAPANGTYKIGAALNVTVHYNRAVTVSGAPYVFLVIGSSYRNAFYLSGSGTADLVFSYTVLEGDLDSDGVSVGGGTGININNGVILDAALGNPANLALSGNPATPALLVDGVRPAVTGVTWPAAGYYSPGMNLTFTVTWDEPLDVVTTGGTPHIQLRLGSSPIQAAYVSGSGTASLVFQYAVSESDTGEVGQAENSVFLNGGTLKDAAGNAANLLMAAAAPSAAQLDSTYKTANSIKSGVILPETDSASSCSYIISSAMQGSKLIVVGYNVFTAAPICLRRYNADGSLDTTFGVSGIMNYQLSPYGSFAKDLIVQVDGKIVVTTSYTQASPDPEVGGLMRFTVDGLPDPTFNSGNPVVVNTVQPWQVLPAADGGYMVFAVDYATTETKLVYYTDNGLLSGTEVIASGVIINLGWAEADGFGGWLVAGQNNAGQAALIMYDKVNNIVYQYIAPSGGVDTAFVYATHLTSAGTILAVNINGAVSQYNANLNYNSTFAGAGHADNGACSGNARALLTSAGKLEIACTNTGQNNLLALTRYNTDGSLDTAFGTNGAATIDLGFLSSPLESAIPVAIQEQPDTKILVFGDTSAGRTFLARMGVGAWVDNTPPAVTSLVLPDAGAYRAAQILSTNIYWDEAVTITGEPQLALTIGATTVQAVYQSLNSTTTRSFFSYPIVSPNTDSDGIAVGALTLNGGTIKDAAGNAAALTLPAVDSSRILVDTTAPTISAITVGASPTRAASVLFQVKFSEAVSGVTAANFTASATGLGGTPTITSFADGGTVGANDTFIVTVSGYTGSGSLQLDKTSNTSIKDIAGNAMASANFTSGDAYAIDTTLPTVSSVAVPADATYTTKTGKDSLVFTLHWSEAVTAAVATPRLALSVGANTRYAPLTTGSGTADWTFTYTVTAADQDTDGISVVELQANGAVLSDTASNSALLALHSVAATTNVKIQGTFTLTLLSAGGGMGDTSTSPSQTSFSDGNTVTLTPLPASNSLFVGFTGDLTGMTNPASLVMTSDKTVSTFFELQGAAYVDPGYDSSTPGWGITRFASIQTAVSTAPLGTLINVYPGVSPYTEAVNINRNVNVVLLNNVILNGTLSQSDGVLDAPGGTLTLGSSFTSTGGTFNPNGGTLKMTGASPAISGTLEFATLEMAGSGTLTASAATVKTQLTLTSGTFSPASGAAFGAVSIASGATLNAPAGIISVSGDWTNNGTYTANGGTIRLNGTTGQVLGGSSPLSFGSLDISSSGVVSTSKALTVSGALNVNTGSLDPFTGSSFSSLTVGPAGTFSLSTAGAIVSVTGPVNNQGSFSPSNGTLNVTGLFTNSGTYEQSGGTVNANAGFSNTGTFSQSGGTLAVTGAFANSGTFAQEGGTLTVSTTFSNSGTFAQSSGTLTVTSGFTNTSAGSYSQTGGATSTPTFANAGSFAQSGGTLTLTGSFTNTGTYAQSGTGVTTVAGNFDNSEPGSFSAAGGTLNLAGNLNHTSTTGSFAATGGMVNFNGSSAQTVSGNVSFANLTVNNPAGVSVTGSLAVSDTLTVSQGAFTPPSGADFTNITIANGAVLTAPTGSMTVSGNFINNGTFNANTGTVTFDGAGAKVISGSSATTFTNLTVAAGASLSVNAVTPATPATTVTGTLLVNGSFAAPAGAILNTLTIGAAGSFDAPAGALSISGNLTNAGTFNANGGTVTLNGTAAQTIDGANAVNFNNLTINNTSSTGAVKYAAGTPAPAVSGLLSILDGTFQPPIGADLNNVFIASGAVLDAPAGSMTVSGDFANAGTFNANAGTVTFDGSAAQTISGAATFYNLVSANTADAPAAVSSSAALTVSNTLSVNDGIFTPYTDSSFKDVTIAADGTLDGSASTLSVSGDWTNAGTFTPGTGKVIFNGTSAQTIGGASTTNFYDLTVNNTSSTGAVKYAALTPAPAVGGLLNLLDGTFQPPSGADLNNVSIASGAVLDAPAGNLTVSGDFANAGTFNANGGTVTFGGSGAQSISGASTFANLTVNKSAGTLGTVNPITVTGTTAVTSGAFAPASGSDFNEISIAAAGAFTAPAGNLTVSGDFANSGTFTPGAGTVTFDGSAAQSISGATNFYDLVIANTAAPAAVSSSAALTVANNLSISDGIFSPLTGSDFHNVSISSGAVLDAPAGNMTVSGNFANNGVFDPDTGTVTFDGSGAQAVSGASTTTFNNLSVNKSAGTLSGSVPVIVTGSTAVNGGTFAPASGSDFNGISIASGASFSAPSGNITVSGDFANAGTFTPGSGTVTFDGSSSQSISGATNFYDLVIANSAAAPAPVSSSAALTVAHSLTVSDGIFRPFTGSSFKDVSIFSGAELDGSGSTLSVGGNWTNTGTFTPGTGTVIFNGASGDQTIGGASVTDFNNLTINNSGTGAVKYAAGTPAPAAAGLLSLLDGTFQPPSGADFNNISIASGAVLDAPASGSLTVSGDFANAGTFNANSGTVTFDGSATQAISGPSLTTFYDVVIANTAAAPTAVSSSTAISAAHNLSVNDGIFAPASGSDFNNINIANGAAFAAPAGNISVSGDFTNSGSFTPGAGTVIFDGSAAQTIGGTSATSFNNLWVNNSSATEAVKFAAGTPVPTVGGLLSVLDGTFQPPSGADLNHVSIASGAVLDAPASGSLTISGDFANAGTFNANAGAVTFDGSAAQAISGSSITTFYDLVIANTAAAPSAVSSSTALNTAHNLSVNDGIFAPTAGLDFSNIAIASGAAFTAPAGNITVSGDFTNSGSFTPGTGTVIFDGSAAQTIGGTSATNFNNLTINNSGSAGAVQFAAGTPAPAVGGLLNLLDGTFQPPSGSDFNSISIASGAVLDAPTSGSMSVSGDFANAGTFNANDSTVTFDGSSAQAISGTSPTTFANLAVNKAGGTLSSTGPLTVTNDLAVTKGAVAPASGSDFKNISIAAAGALTAPAGNMTVSGDFANSGTFTPGTGTVTFDGSTAQSISGATNFYDLVIANTAAAPAAVSSSTALSVANNLAVSDGIFSPFSGSDFNNIHMASGAVLDAPAGNLTVSGNITNDGAFNANGGTVTFDGSGDQAIAGSTASTFANLIVDKSAGTLSTTQALSVTGGTTVSAGIFAPAAGSDFNDISIASGASFTAPAGNLSVSGDFANAGTFTPGTGTVTFDGADAQSISGTTSFYDLVIANSAAAPAAVSSSAALSAAHSLAVSDGIFSPAGGSSFKDVSISSGAELDGSGGTLSVGGNWTNAGTFTPGTGTVIFNGASGDQTIGGASVTDFNNLTINNSGTGAVKYAASTPAPSVAGLLNILDGAFQPPSGSDFNNISIASGAVLTAPAGPAGTMTVSGDFTNDGTFNPNGGSVIFDGSGPQALASASTTPFATLIVNKPTGTLTASSPITVSGPTTITSGGFDPSSGSSFNSLAIGQDGSFLMSSPGIVTVTNAVTNAGTFAPSNGTLNAGGGFTNTATGSFEPTGGILNVTGSFTNAGDYAAQGGTTNVSGSFTNTGSISSSGGILDIGGSLTNSGSYLASGGTLNLAGNLSNTGSFLPTGGTVVFDGTSGQTFTGNAPTFASLTVNNTSLAGVNIVPPMTVTDLLTIASGKFNPPSNSQFNDILINSAGTLILDSTDTIKVAGDFTNDGTFTSKNSTVILNGSTDQTIGGSKPVTFRNLEIANTGTSSVVDTSAAVTVTGSLTLTDGVFSPFDGSQFSNVIIQPNGTFGLANGAAVTIVNTLVNNGTFAPQNGLVDLWGDFTNNGTFSPSGGTVAVGGDFLNYGTFAASGGTVSVISDFVNASTGHFTSTGGSLNLNGDLFNNGDFNPTGASSVAFIGALEQSISGLNVPTFANLLLDNPAGVTPHLPINVQGQFDLNQGSFTPTTGSSFNDMRIGAGTSLTLDPGDEISVAGDVTNDGVFDVAAGTVTLDGDGAQVLNGSQPFIFGDLVVDNSGTGAVSSLLPLTVLGNLTVSDGTLLATSGSTFNNVSTSPGAVLDGSAGPITISGDWNGLGSFIAGSSTVTFNGTPPQAFSGSNVFNDLVIADGSILELAANANLGLNGALNLLGSGDLDTSSNQPNTLTLTGTAPQTLPSGLALSSLVIDPGATFLAPADLFISGDFTNNGVFNPGAGTVTFDGVGDQAITGSGPTTFNNLVIANAGTGEVTTNPAVIVTGSLEVNDGVFAPAGGSDFNDVTIGANGTLDGSGGTLYAGGDWLNNGTFDPGTGSIVFDGAAGQTIGGSEPTTFYDLVIDNPAGVVDTTPISVTNDLTVDPNASFIPADGSIFNNVTIGAGAELIVPPGVDLTITGDYINNGASDLYTLTINTAGDGTGTASYLPAGGAFTKGTVLTLTAVPGSHSAFTGWSGGGLSDTATPKEITLNANTTVTATFDVQRFTLTLNTTGAGSGTISGVPGPEISTARYKYGEVVSLTPNPDTGSVFTGWSGDLSGWANPATVTMTADMVVTANFRSDDQNQPPAFTSTPVDETGKGLIYTYHIATSDTNGDQTAVTILDKPAWLNLVDDGDGTSTLQGTPPAPGKYTVTIEVRDALGGASQQTYTLTVNYHIMFILMYR